MERKSFYEKFDTLKPVFKKLVEAKTDGGEICEQMDLTEIQAKELHYVLVMSGELQPQPIQFSTYKALGVSDKGNIFVSAGRIKGLGFKDYFPPEAILKAVRQGNGLYIESVPKNTELTVESSEQVTDNHQTLIAVTSEQVAENEQIANVIAMPALASTTTCVYIGPVVSAKTAQVN